MFEQQSPSLTEMIEWCREDLSWKEHHGWPDDDLLKQRAVLARLKRLEKLAEGTQCWRHKARGTTYRLEEPIAIQCETPVQDGEELLAYRAIHDGKLWGRRAPEFHDGRYEPVTVAEGRSAP